MFSVLAVLMASLPRRGNNESDSNSGRETTGRKPRLATTCSLCTLETRIGAEVKTGDSAICIRCGRKFTVEDIYPATKTPSAAAADVTSLPLKSTPAEPEIKKRPVRCTRCNTGLLPKESRCTYCGLKVAEMVIKEPVKKSDSSGANSRVQSEEQESSDHPQVNQEAPPGIMPGYSFEMKIGRGSVVAVTIDPQSHVIAACGEHGTLDLFSADHGRRLAETRVLTLRRGRKAFINAAAFLPDGRLLIAGAIARGLFSLHFGPEPYLAIWDPQSGVEIQRLNLKCGPKAKLAVADDGRIAAIGPNRWVEVFAPGGTEPEHRFRVKASRATNFLGGHPVANFSAGGDYLACRRGRTACLWDVRRGSQIGEYRTASFSYLLRQHRRVLQAATPSSDGNRILLGGGGQGGFSTSFPEKSVTHVPFPSGLKRKLLGEVSAWNTESGELQGLLADTEPELDAVMDVAFLHDDEHCAIRTANGSVLFWIIGESRVTTHANPQLRWFRRWGGVLPADYLNVSPDGRFVVTRKQESDDTIKLYRTPWQVERPAEHLE